MVCVMGGKWPNSCGFVMCCFQGLFEIARSILVYFSLSFFSMHFISADVVHPHSSMNTGTAWKKSCFILTDRLNFHMINNLSVVVHTFRRDILSSISVDEILLPSYVNWSIKFRRLSLRLQVALFCLKHMYSFFNFIYFEVNASLCLFLVMQ